MEANGSRKGEGFVPRIGEHRIGLAEKESVRLLCLPDRRSAARMCGSMQKPLAVRAPVPRDRRRHSRSAGLDRRAAKKQPRRRTLCIAAIGGGHNGKQTPGASRPHQRCGGLDALEQYRDCGARRATPPVDQTVSRPLTTARREALVDQLVEITAETLPVEVWCLPERLADLGSGNEPGGRTALLGLRVGTRLPQRRCLYVGFGRRVSVRIDVPRAFGVSRGGARPYAT